jgi:Double zinc ribbon
MGGRIQPEWVAGLLRNTQQLQSMVAGPQHDSALKAAVEEISPQFKQCTRCGNWVCEPVCWNAKAGLCETCAPDMEEEIASAQAHAARAQAMERARDVDFIGQRDLGRVVAVNCTSCGAQTHGSKFCPECGTPTAKQTKCRSCGVDVNGSPKFCPDCGSSMNSG